ncbi:SGNH/GDSL hydrolase family protein [Armatimonas sp.]|uniref:SGNH/GDSL hydrolase family protein n=1 Tax=Armatimonas sp. TaxID=1872638 RepID=UPI00374DCB0D
MDVFGESFVLTHTDLGRFCVERVTKGSVRVRSTFLPDKPGSIVYTERQDYVVDYVKGTLARTPGSRIPDFSTNTLYGQKDFDHTKFPGFTNHPWFVWVDYKASTKTPWARRNGQSRALSAVKKKLQTGGAFKIVSYGDSITAGGEASEDALRFQWRWAASLGKKFPKAAITIEDLSLSGYTSRQGIDWFDKKPEALRPVTTLGTCDKPDLVLVGFGMNDHNRGSAEPEVFKNNLVTLAKLIQERKGASVVLFSAFPPNDDWHYGTHRMAQFAAATKQAASEAGCAYADVFSTWEWVLKRKDQPSLLGNNINHPNDFGHWLYAQAFEAMAF